VTAQNITCLHTSAAASGPADVAHMQDASAIGPRE